MVTDERAEVSRCHSGRYAGEGLKLVGYEAGAATRTDWCVDKSPLTPERPAVVFLEYDEVEQGQSASLASRVLVQPVSMERVVDPPNLSRAYRRVVGNKGSAGVDGMTVKDLRD